ncbi:galactoside alpha-(1,2)-fucosyltransferase 2-like [Hyperolius riggenbachi]|uniref:galactoside alpha-(1,2)-fucosyltransferase 2-like n=1 Tax=Hyperolius riggenbachi TaxID=752182 RepID=UPI0035A292C8
MSHLTLAAGNPGKRNKQRYWIILAIILLLVITNFSFDYHSNLHINLFMEFMKNIKLNNRTKEISPGSSPENPRALSGMWTINAAGRLGNLMGEYATLYSLAKMNGHQAYISENMHKQLSKIFKINLPLIHPEVSSHIKWRYYGLNNWMSEEYQSIHWEYVHFIGFPSSFTFYHHIKAEILREFTFHDFIKEESYAYLNKVNGDRGNVTFVGVHVRRGDIVPIMSKKWRGVVADKEYLQKAMDYFRNKYENPLFIVTSNEMDWCRENIDPIPGDVHFAGDGDEGSPGRDFALLAHCNHTILTIGTFGIWVAYLVGGETIYLANYTMPDSQYLEYFKYEAVFLPEWIGIPADLSPLLSQQNP